MSRRGDGTPAGWALAQAAMPVVGVLTAFVTLELINMLSWVFAYVYSTTKGGPNFASYVLEFYVFDNAFTFRAPSFAAAAAILLLAATTVLIAIQVRRTSVEVNLE